MGDDLLGRYLELLRKVDGFSQSVIQTCGGLITCRMGCDDCCKKSFTVFQVEARNLIAGFGKLEPAYKRIITDRCRKFNPSNSPCILLDSGKCLLYEHRPIICRTHGLPLVSGSLSINGTPRTTLCEKNFSEPGSLSRLPENLVLNLDTLNALLSAVNMLYMKEIVQREFSPEIKERVWFRDIFKD